MDKYDIEVMRKLLEMKDIIERLILNEEKGYMILNDSTLNTAYMHVLAIN